MRLETPRSARPALRRRSLVAVLAAALVALAACTDDTPPEPPGVPVGPDGGTLTVDGVGEVRLPPGALRSTTHVLAARAPAHIDGLAPEGAVRLGDAELVVRVDPARVVGRYTVTLVVPDALAPPETEPARLFVSMRDESGHAHETGAPSWLYPVLWTDAARADGQWRLSVDMPPPATPETRFSAWLAPVPVVRRGVGEAYGTARAGGAAGPLFRVTYTLAPAQDLMALSARVGSALDASEVHFRTMGYRVPPHERDPRSYQPVAVTVTNYPSAVHANSYGWFSPNDAGSIVLNLRQLEGSLGRNPSLLEVTAAHEVFHAEQYWMTNFPSMHAGRWMMEGSAVVMMDEAFDNVPTLSFLTCLNVTRFPLDQRGGGCGVAGYETHPFFRWLGPGALKAVLDEAERRVGLDHAATVDLGQLALERMEAGGRRYFDFAEELLYLKRFDRMDASEDTRAARLDETASITEPFQGADLWSSCRFGEPYVRPEPAGTCPGSYGTLDAFHELPMPGTAARMGTALGLGASLDHLTAIRYDLQNRTGRAQRFLLEVEAMGARPERAQARVYRRGEPTSQVPSLGTCDAMTLTARMSCIYDDEDPGTGVVDGTRVLVVANNGLNAASNGRFQGNWRALPVRLRMAAMNHGNGQSGRPGTALPLPFAVEALDLSGMPMGEVRVTWEVVEGGGRVSVREGRSAAETGRAETVLTLGPMPGVNRVRARAYNLPDPNHPLYRELEGSPVEFVTGDLPRLRMASRDHGNGQSGVPGMRLTLPFAVEVVDAMDRPVGDVRVTWEAVEGGGAVAPRENRTAPGTGRAESVLTLGPAVGLHRVLARAWDMRDMELPGSPVTFTTAGVFSCDFVAGPTRQCSEFEIASMGVEEQRRACTGAGRTWAERPCPRAGAVGGCRLTLPMGMGWTTAWYYGAPFTPDLVRATCAAIGAMFVSP